MLPFVALVGFSLIVFSSEINPDGDYRTNSPETDIDSYTTKYWATDNSEFNHLHRLTLQQDKSDDFYFDEVELSQSVSVVQRQVRDASVDHSSGILDALDHSGNGAALDDTDVGTGSNEGSSDDISDEYWGRNPSPASVGDRSASGDTPNNTTATTGPPQQTEYIEIDNGSSPLFNNYLVTSERPFSSNSLDGVVTQAQLAESLWNLSITQKMQLLGDKPADNGSNETANLSSEYSGLGRLYTGQSAFRYADISPTSKLRTESMSRDSAGYPPSLMTPLGRKWFHVKATTAVQSGDILPDNDDEEFKNYEVSPETSVHNRPTVVSDSECELLGITVALAGLSSQSDVSGMSVNERSSLYNGFSDIQMDRNNLTSPDENISTFWRLLLSNKNRHTDSQPGNTLGVTTKPEFNQTHPEYISQGYEHSTPTDYSSTQNIDTAPTGMVDVEQQRTRDEDSKGFLSWLGWGNRGRSHDHVAREVSWITENIKHTDHGNIEGTSVSSNEMFTSTAIIGMIDDEERTQDNDSKSGFLWWLWPGNLGSDDDNIDNKVGSITENVERTDHSNIEGTSDSSNELLTFTATTGMVDQLPQDGDSKSFPSWVLPGNLNSNENNIDYEMISNTVNVEPTDHTAEGTRKSLNRGDILTDTATTLIIDREQQTQDIESEEDLLSWLGWGNRGVNDEYIASEVSWNTEKIDHTDHTTTEGPRNSFSNNERLQQTRPGTGPMSNARGYEFTESSITETGRYSNGYLRHLSSSVTQADNIPDKVFTQPKHPVSTWESQSITGLIYPGLYRSSIPLQKSTALPPSVTFSAKDHVVDHTGEYPVRIFDHDVQKNADVSQVCLLLRLSEVSYVVFNFSAGQSYGRNFNTIKELSEDVDDLVTNAIGSVRFIDELIRRKTSMSLKQECMEVYPRSKEVVLSHASTFFVALTEQVGSHLSIQWNVSYYQNNKSAVPVSDYGICSLYNLESYCSRGLCYSVVVKEVAVPLCWCYRGFQGDRCHLTEAEAWSSKATLSDEYRPTRSVLVLVIAVGCTMLFVMVIFVATCYYCIEKIRVEHIKKSTPGLITNISRPTARTPEKNFPVDTTIFANESLLNKYHSLPVPTPLRPNKRLLRTPIPATPLLTVRKYILTPPPESPVAGGGRRRFIMSANSDSYYAPPDVIPRGPRIGSFYGDEFTRITPLKPRATPLVWRTNTAVKKYSSTPLEKYKSPYRPSRDLFV